MASCKRERVDHRAQHAHEVGVRAVHTGQLTGRATPDVAAAHDDREFESPAFHGRGDLYREKVHRGSVNGFVARGRSQRFAREL